MLTWACVCVVCSQIGIIEDQENRERLSKLLRFFSSKSEGDNLVGLEEYIGRMKEGQKAIYYMVRPHMYCICKSASSTVLEQGKGQSVYRAM